MCRVDACVDCEGRWLDYADSDAISLPFGIHLQWFAAEDEGRTEEPTEHKIKKAREEGRVAKSYELSSSVILIIGTGALGILSSHILETFISMMRFFFERSADVAILENGAAVRAFFEYFIRLAAPLLIIVFIVAALVNLIQVGFLFTVKPLVPDFTRIAPRFGRYFKRALFSAEAGFNFLKSIAKVVVIGIIGFLNIQAEFNRLMNLMHMHFFQAFTYTAQLVFRIVLETGLVLLVVSIIDYLFVRRQYREQLKMSKQEVKEERKMYEGDPLIRSRLRERMREVMLRNMMKAVPKADVVITNPTHFAVALEWDRLRMAAPTVTAKGADHVAANIKAVAAEHGVAIIENKPLARTLYDEVDIGETIPEKFYEVLATILAHVYQMKGTKLAAVNG
ncbi:MAG: flagellar biosynthesis protein FlhB [Spirochaetales bacterium]|nr:flagellar biosynthesis protein FlhB [Spirochaetales bacterium]